MIRVIMVRHGESLWNLEHRYQGQQDSGLTDRGRRQAELVAGLLADSVERPTAIWSSDLPRARDTAAAYARLVDSPVHTDPRLREVDIGDWSGRLLADIAREQPDDVAAAAAGVDVRRGGGETFGEVRIRVAAWLDEVTAGLRDTEADGRTTAPVLAFSHGGAIRVAAAHAAGTPTPGHERMAPPTNCSRTELVIDGTRLALAAYNLPLPDQDSTGGGTGEVAF